MIQIDIAIVDKNLLADIDNSETRNRSEWTGWYAEIDDDEIDSNQGYHIVHHADAQRGGIVFVGFGSSGRTSWTDADGPEDVLQRYEADEMAN